MNIESAKRALKSVAQYAEFFAADIQIRFNKAVEVLTSDRIREVKHAKIIYDPYPELHEEYVRKCTCNLCVESIAIPDFYDMKYCPFCGAQFE